MALDLLAAAAVAPAAALAPAPRGQGRLSELQRWSIVALHNDGRTRQSIAQKLQCSERAVQRPLKRFRQHNTPLSGSRSGRPRSTSEAEDISMAVTARVEPFTPPRGIRP
jgi:transposase